MVSVRADRDSMPQVIEGALRWETPLLTVARTAAEDVELGGVRIPAGGFVAISLGAANRDPARYPDPDAFDIYRKVSILAPKTRTSTGCYSARPRTCWSGSK